MNLATGLMSLGQAQDSSGRSCAERVGIVGSYFEGDDDDDDDDEVCSIMCALLIQMVLYIHKIIHSDLCNKCILHGYN